MDKHEDEHEKEINKVKASSAFGVFALLTIITVTLMLLFFGYFLLNFCK